MPAVGPSILVLRQYDVVVVGDRNSQGRSVLAVWQPAARNLWQGTQNCLVIGAVVVVVVLLLKLLHCHAGTGRCSCIQLRPGGA